MKKKLLSVLCATMLIVTLITALPLTAEAVSNPYGKTQTIDGITTVRCTWYAWQQVYDNTGVALPNFGNAGNWYTSAQNAGYAVGTVAKPKSIAVWSGGTYGHVSYVVSVNGSKMTVNEGGMLNAAGTAAYNGDGIYNGSVCNSTVGAVKSQYSSKILVGFIYPTESVSPSSSVSVTHGWGSNNNVITESNAIVYGTVTKPSSYSATKFGISIRRSDGTYAEGKTYSHSASQDYAGTAQIKLTYDIKDEVGFALVHGTSYTYQFFAIVNGVDYYSPEATFTTTGSHSYGSWQTVTAATCTTAGSQKRTCACGAVENVTISALGHNYSSAYTVDKAASCTVAGSKSKHCTRCSATTSVTSIPATGHSYGSWQTVTNATCTATGSQKHSCTSCGNTEYKTISALGHNFSSSWTVDKAASCTVSGTKSHHCTRSGCTARSSVTTVPANGHSWSGWTVTKKATYEETGLKVRECTVNGCSAEESSVIAKLPLDGHTHSFGEWATETAATCTKNGTQKRMCSICKSYETQEITAHGHKLSEWKTEKVANCTDEGIETRRCTVCNESETHVTPAHGHAFGEWLIKVEATADTEGTLERKCTNCSETETQTTPKLDASSDTVSDSSSSDNISTNDSSSPLPDTSDKDTSATPDDDSDLTMTIIICAAAIGALLASLIVLVIIKKKK